MPEIVLALPFATASHLLLIEPVGPFVLSLEPQPSASAVTAITATTYVASRRNLRMWWFSFLPVTVMCSPLRPHGERVTQPVPEKVERERRDDQEPARE